MPLSAGLGGWAAGVALQWPQAQLWPTWAYAALVALAVAAMLVLAVARATGGRRAGRVGGPGAITWACAAGVCAALLGFGTTGMRAAHQQADVLAPHWEERPLWLTGTVADLPQSHPDGQTLVVAVEQVDVDGAALASPRRVRLFWPAAPSGLQAGQVWRWPVRLRAPHGLANPHGFDRELWLWEQGIGATGVVRAGRQVPAPVLLGHRHRHAIDRWRGELTAAVLERVPDARSAGVMAALLVGNQSAIGGVR